MAYWSWITSLYIPFYKSLLNIQLWFKQIIFIAFNSITSHFRLNHSPDYLFVGSWIWFADISLNIVECIGYLAFGLEARQCTASGSASFLHRGCWVRWKSSGEFLRWGRPVLGLVVPLYISYWNIDICNDLTLPLKVNVRLEGSQSSPPYRVRVTNVP